MPRFAKNWKFKKRRLATKERKEHKKWTKRWVNHEIPEIHEPKFRFPFAYFAVKYPPPENPGKDAVRFAGLFPPGHRGFKK